MTREEFDAKARELHGQKSVAIMEVELMQNEVKEEIAVLRRRMSDLHRDLNRLEQHRMILGQRRMILEKEWKERINKFYEDNQQTASRQLKDVSDWALVNEFNARGFRGEITNEANDENYLHNLNAKLNSDNDGTV